MYSTFGESVRHKRCGGDINPDLAPFADMSKLVGNAVYGKAVTDEEHHNNVSYVSGEKKVSLKVKQDNVFWFDLFTILRNFLKTSLGCKIVHGYKNKWNHIKYMLIKK